MLTARAVEPVLCFQLFPRYAEILTVLLDELACVHVAPGRVYSNAIPRSHVFASFA